MDYPTYIQQKMDAESLAGAARINQSGMRQYDASKPSTLTDAVRTSTEIEGRLIRVNDALERLSNRVSVLDDRLHPVIRASGSGGDSALSAPLETLSPLGDSIRSIEHRIDNACDRLEALLASLAL